MDTVHTKYVSQERFLDTIEADWRKSFGIVARGCVLNNAVSIDRTPGCLIVVNDAGDTIIYKVRARKGKA